MIETIVILLLVGLDQLVKYLVRAYIPLGGQVGCIPGVLGLTHIHNNGAAFSMLEGARWFFVVLTVAFVIFGLYLLYAQKITHPLGKWSLVLVLAGAVGNLIDRAAVGYVVDMFEVLLFRFAIFNVADIFVVVGGILFCYYYAFVHDKYNKSREQRHDHSL